MEVPDGQRQTPLGVKQGLRALNVTLTPPVPYKTNGVNNDNPRPINLQHQQRQNSMLKCVKHSMLLVINELVQPIAKALDDLSEVRATIEKT